MYVRKLSDYIMSFPLQKPPLVQMFPHCNEGESFLIFFWSLNNSFHSLCIIDLVFKMQIWIGGSLDPILGASRRDLGQVH